MAGFNREDWEDLNVTKEELETLTQAIKKEEFRKLLAEYAEEITDPKNRKIYQDEIIQLEAERGVDCTFVNPEPGFVVKTSVNGDKKAFVNICKNHAVGRPTYKREFKKNTPGLSWSIPMCQAPKREDFDKKRNRCSVFDVVFHPDTLCLAEKDLEFKKLVIDTALNAVEDSNKVKLDKKNIKFPKLKYKGIPFATVIRKKSKNPPTLTEEEIEFQNTIKYPFKPPKETAPVVKNFETKKEELKEKYTVPKYVIKHSSEIELQEFTYDKNAKVNAAIPKELVIEINLPLLNSTNTVTLDIMEKSLHLISEKPVKYKLDLQLPYMVNEENGTAKFDKDKRLLVIKLPVIKARLSFKDLMREDSGVESDSSPVGSISNNEYDNIEEKNISGSLEDSYLQTKDDGVLVEENKKLSYIESEKDYRTTKDEVEFLDSDKLYLLPAFTCNLDDDKICFVLNVKNVDPNSLVKKSLNCSACYLKFFSIGSGFFPVYYAFLIDFKDECNVKDVTCDVWDNNVTVLIDLVKNDQAISKYHIGLTKDTLIEHSLNQPLELKKIMEEINPKDDEEEKSNLKVQVESANVDEVVISVIPEEPEDLTDGKENEILATSAPCSMNSDSKTDNKNRTFSESSSDELIACPLVRKSILKKRIHRSLSESNADDYVFSCSVEKAVSDGSDLCIHDELPAVSHIKKTVRFNDHIRQQLFRVNSSILGQRKKNKKKSKNKRKALARRLSESENSEIEDKEENKKIKKSKKAKNSSLIEVLTNKEEKENQNITESLKDENTEKVQDQDKNTEENKPKYGLKKDDKIFEFKSDLIFDLDM